MPDDERLHAPAPVVAKGKPVKVSIELGRRDVPAVGPILLLTVYRIVCHFWVKPDDHTPDGLVVLVDQELEEQKVHNGRPKDATPEGRMRPGEGAIGEGEDGDDEEEDGDPDQPAVDVAVNVRKLSIFRLFSRPLFFTGTCLIFFSQVENFVSRALI